MLSKRKEKVLVVDRLFLRNVEMVTALLLASGQSVDLNGEAAGMILDADADTSVSAPTDDQIDIEINGADDFRFLANIFRALSGSVIETNTINETTAANGVTVDSVLLKDGGIRLSDGAALAADVISEKVSASGVTVDGLLVKDGVAYTPTPVAALSGDGAVTIAAYNKAYFITKGTAAAITIVDPTATTHDGVELTFIATTAAAHTLSNAAGSGFFSSGGSSKDVATFGGAIGDRITILAYQAKWYIKDSLNITLG